MSVFSAELISGSWRANLRAEDIDTLERMVRAVEKAAQPPEPPSSEPAAAEAPASFERRPVDAEVIAPRWKRELGLG